MELRKLSTRPLYVILHQSNVLLHQALRSEHWLICFLFQEKKNNGNGFYVLRHVPPNFYTVTILNVEEVKCRLTRALSMTTEKCGQSTLSLGDMIFHRCVLHLSISVRSLLNICSVPSHSGQWHHRHYQWAGLLFLNVNCHLSVLSHFTHSKWCVVSSTHSILIHFQNGIKDPHRYIAITYLQWTKNGLPFIMCCIETSLFSQINGEASLNLTK